MPGLPVFRINGTVPKNQSKTSQIFDLKEAYEDVLKTEIHDVSILCMQALQTKVPVRTRELRKAIRIEVNSEDTAVSIVADLHQNSSTKTPITNPELAEILEIGQSRPGEGWQLLLPGSRKPLRRSRKSDKSGSFTELQKGDPTKDWVYQAQEEVAKLL